MNRPEICFKLENIFSELNNQFFNGAITANIKWGQKRVSHRAKRSILLGSYNIQKKTITIHPALNQPEIPLICLERIVFHEMLHEKFPRKKTSSKNCIHHPEFLNFEKSYPYLRQADIWIKNNLKKLLAYKG